MAQQELFGNNASAPLAVALTSTATSISLVTGQGAEFPTPSGSQFFWITLVNGSNLEICKCTSNVSDTLTVIRGQQGTTAQAFATTGTTVELRLTESSLEQFAQTSGDDFTGPVTAPSIVLANQMTPLNNPAIQNANYTASIRDVVLADTSVSSWVLTLPASPSLGDCVLAIDLASTFQTNNLVISGGANKIMGSTGNLVMDVNGATAWLMYTNATYGWILVQP